MFSKLEGHFPFCVTKKVPREGLEKGDDPTIDLYREQSLFLMENIFMKKLLVIGGSGHVSGAVVRAALHEGFDVSTLTRGQRQAVGRVRAYHADRHDAAAMLQVMKELQNEHFDAVIDCIGFNAEDMRQDLELFAPLTGQLIFISTDWVYEPALRRFPQPVNDSPFITGDRDGYEAYGWGKLSAENELRAHAPAHLTNVRAPA